MINTILLSLLILLVGFLIFISYKNYKSLLSIFYIKGFLKDINKRIVEFKTLEKRIEKLEIENDNLKTINREVNIEPMNFYDV